MIDRARTSKNVMPRKCGVSKRRTTAPWVNRGAGRPGGGPDSSRARCCQRIRLLEHQFELLARDGSMLAVPPARKEKPCVFCAIVRGEQAAHIVTDQPHVVAFLDSHPLFLGHVLLVPRAHVSTLLDLPLEDVPPYFLTVQRMARAVTEAMGCDGTMVLNNNVVSQSVPHLHVHVIPRNRGDGLRFWLGPRKKYADEADAADHARRIVRV